jgi:tetratricopeptide (TPR) repeat protein
LLIQQQEFEQALPLLVHAAMLNPEDYRARVNLAGIYKSLDANEMAAETYEHALQLNPAVAESHLNLGEIYYDQNEVELALSSFENALGLRPSYYQATMGKGRCLERMGRLGEAAVMFLAAHRLDPERITPVSELIRLPSGLVDFDGLAAIEALDERMIAKGAATAEWRRLLQFPRTEALDRQGRHREAFEAALEANQAKIDHEKFDYAVEQEANAEILEFIEANRFDIYQPASGGRASVMSLLIIGASRSGKSSLETLLGAVRGIKLGYENNIVQRRVKRAAQFAARLGIDNLLQLPDEFNPMYRDLYMSELTSRAGNASAYTITSPGNIVNLGRLIGCIPNVRAVFLRRDRHDQALRMFFKSYAKKNIYSYRIRDIQDYLDWYTKLQDVWLARFPDHIITVAYEDMVACPEATVKRVAEFCGLEPPEGELPDIGDDSGCAVPYRAWLDAEAT